MLKSGIYRLLNVSTGKFYIGSGLDIVRRWRGHKSNLNSNCHCNYRLQNAWNKYGQDSFRFYVLEYCAKEMLLTREQYWFDVTGCSNRDIGYNIAKLAGSTSGHKLSDETKLKMSIAAKNRTDEQKLKLAESRKGKKRTDETKAKMRAAKLGKPKSEETKARMSRAKQNMSDETRARMTAANRKRALENKINILFGTG
jgi:group I intron endonuclease